MTLDTASAGFTPRTFQFLSVAAIAALALTACNGDNGGDDADTEDNGDAEVTETEDNGDDADNDEADAEEGEDAEAGGVVTIEDDRGTHEIDFSQVDSIGAFDNRSFRTLEAMGVELTVAARSLMDDAVHGYATDEDILDTGNHREPDFEQLIASAPQLVITGQRYGQYAEEMDSLLPDSDILIFDEEVNNPETFMEGLVNKTESLGELFGEQDVAQELVDEFQAEIDRISEAYDGESTVMGLLTSGGDISYVAPGTGRTIGPLFPAFDLVPALEIEGEDDSHGDDISVEAIADANPDWLLVLDRDARLGADDEDYQPADELIAESPALQEVTAVQEGNIVYTPEEMYLTEDIEAYTVFLRDIADALESSS